MAWNQFDIQGEFVKIPYDFRMPTVTKVKERWWNKGGPMFTPKLIGWGFELNFAHKGTWILLALVFSVALLVSGLA